MTDRTCSFDGCDRPWRSKGWCVGHYYQQARGITLGPLRTIYKAHRHGDLLTWFMAGFDMSGGPDACQEWQRTRKFGYGRCHPMVAPFGTERTPVLRWILANGPIPDGLLVLHHCDNRPCGNPRHLWLGTVTENMEDRNRKWNYKRWG